MDRNRIIPFFETLCAGVRFHDRGRPKTREWGKGAQPLEPDRFQGLRALRETAAGERGMQRKEVVLDF